jgi:hypothetical protein
MGPEMTSGPLIELLQLFESAGIEVWLDGGWAVDALLGTQTRPHKDVDITRCFATLTGTFRRRRTCEIWSCSGPASASSYRRICGEITCDAVV